MASSNLANVPAEIRAMIYDHLIEARRTSKPWEGSYSQPRLIYESHGGLDRRSYENWSPSESEPSHSSRWLSTSINLTHASALMRTCKLLHHDLASWVYSQIIWHARVGKYSVPALPLQICPSYAAHVAHVALHLQHGNSLDGVLEGIDHVYIKFSSFWRNVQTFARLLASQGRLASLQVDALLPSECAVIDVVEALAPLRGRVEEVRVGRLDFETFDRVAYSCERKLSNAGYLKMREVLGGTQVKWSYPCVDAQYKD